MFNDIRSRVRTVLGVGVVAALVVAGLALAQNNGNNSNSSSGNGSQSSTESGTAIAGHPPGPPPGGGVMFGPGPGGKDLTYAEFHTLENGQAKVTRLDNGTVDSVSDSEITITENDGSQVTVPVDQNTKVVAGPGTDEQVTDLQQGQQVQVSHPQDGAADVIMVPPTKAELQRMLKNLPKPPAGAKGKRFFRTGPQGDSQGFAIPAPPPPGAPQG
jgi:ABC-type Fe3+-hydroxamate transport system substrate-binding protein